MTTFAVAQPKDEVVAVVDNSAILRSDLAQSVAEISHQLQKQNKPVPPQPYLEQQALEQLIVRQAQLEQVKRYNIRPDEKSLNEAVLKVARDSGSPSLEAFQQNWMLSRRIRMPLYVTVLQKIWHLAVYASKP